MWVYLLGVGIEGTTGIGPVETEIDLSFGDILDHLELSAMGLFRARKGRWAFLGDAVFMGLGLLISCLQAFIFALLTMIYIGLALDEPH